MRRGQPRRRARACAASPRRSLPPPAPAVRAAAVASVRPRRACGGGTARADRRSRRGSARSRIARRSACEKISSTPPTRPSIRIGNPTPDTRPSASATDARGKVGGARSSSHSASPTRPRARGGAPVRAACAASSRGTRRRGRRRAPRSPAAPPDRAASSSRRPSRARADGLEHPADRKVDRLRGGEDARHGVLQLGSLFCAPAVGHLLDHGADTERLAVAVEHRVVARQPEPLGRGVARRARDHLERRHRLARARARAARSTRAPGRGAGRPRQTSVPGDPRRGRSLITASALLTRT